MSALPTIRANGGGHYIIGPTTPSLTREPMTPGRFRFIEPLLRVQGYLISVRYSENGPAEADVNMSTFRTMPSWKGENLAHRQARYAGIAEVDESPWLTCKPSPETRGKAVLARSGRYHNERFSWAAILREFPDHVFIGTVEEWTSLQSSLQRSIPYRPVKDMLEMAQLIKGSAVFVGNQSCPCWIAMAMGHPVIQEVCVNHPDSRIERAGYRFVV